MARPTNGQWSMSKIKPLVKQWADRIKSKTWTFHDNYSVGSATNLTYLLESIFPTNQPDLQYLRPGYHFLYNNQPNTLLGTDWYDDYQAPRDDSLNALYKRRLWVGGQIDFHTAPKLSSAMVCEESITSVKSLFDSTFVTIRRELNTYEGSPILQESRTLAYTNQLYSPSTQLFTLLHPENWYIVPFTLTYQDVAKFCALTYNLHKIHIDPNYCQTQENLPNVLVPGPFMVTSALNVFQYFSPRRRITSIKYKNIEPCFVNSSLQLIVQQHGSSEEKCSVLLISVETKKKFMDATISCVPETT